MGEFQPAAPLKYFDFLSKFPSYFSMAWTLKEPQSQHPVVWCSVHLKRFFFRAFKSKWNIHTGDLVTHLSCSSPFTVYLLVSHLPGQTQEQLDTVDRPTFISAAHCGAADLTVLLNLCVLSGRSTENICVKLMRSLFLSLSLTAKHLTVLLPAHI